MKIETFDLKKKNSGGTQREPNYANVVLLPLRVKGMEGSLRETVDDVLHANYDFSLFQ